MKEEYETLTDLLSDGMPDYLNRANRIHIPRLAAALGVSRQIVHKQISKQNSISAHMARQIIAMTNRRVTPDHIIKFISNV